MSPLDQCIAQAMNPRRVYTPLGLVVSALDQCRTHAMNPRSGCKHLFGCFATCKRFCTAFSYPMSRFPPLPLDEPMPHAAKAKAACLLEQEQRKFAMATIFF